METAINYLPNVLIYKGVYYGDCHELLAWGRGTLAINKMADQVLPLSWLRRVGYTQICVARGIVSWGSKDNDAAGELQLWHHERDHDYCLYARKTASDDDVAVFTCKAKLRTLDTVLR